MKNNRIKKFLFIFILLGPPFIEISGQASLPGQETSEYEKRLTEITAQITGIRKQIAQEDKRKTSVLSRLSKIGLNKTLIKKEISLYNTQLNKADLELAAIQKSVPDLKKKLQNEEEAIEKILVTLYKFGKFSTFDFLLQADDVSALLSESKNLALLAQYEESLLSDYRTALQNLKTAEENLEKKKQEMSQLIDKAQDKRKEYSEQEKKYNSLIQEIEKNKETHLKTLQELKERAEQLQKLIQKLQDEQISLPYALIPLYEKKGSLPWPLVGKVITLFGPSRHRRFNTFTQNNGIEISPQKDTVVKAIHAGRVVWADYFDSYGFLIIIDHGLTYYSLYGHLGPGFMVKKGDYVKAGQSIATVGEFGSLKEETLYFEIRHNTEPLNPLQWLERR